MSILDKIENIVVMGILNDKGEIIRDFSFGTMSGKLLYELSYNFSFLEFDSKKEVVEWFRKNGWDIQFATIK